MNKAGACGLVLGLVLFGTPYPGWSAPAALSPAQATQLLKGIGLRVAACNPDSPVSMTDIRTAPPVSTVMLNLSSAQRMMVYPVKGRFVGTCRGGSAASGRVDTFTVDGVFDTNFYKDSFGEWKHTNVLRPHCDQVRTSYQVTGGPVTAVADKSICDYTSTG